MLQMLKTLRRWLGWDADSGPFDFSDLEIPPRARPTPAPSPAPKAQPKPLRTAVAPPAAAKAKPAKRERDLLDILDNPKLTLDRPTSPEDGFDPYNTGAFNRSASWERISRTKR